jgi:hypothetical protein
MKARKLISAISQAKMRQLDILLTLAVLFLLVLILPPIFRWADSLRSLFK